MIIPIRCFTCNKVIANKWNTYCNLVEKGCEPEEIFKKIQIERICCKRMILSNIDNQDDLNKYNTLPDKVKTIDNSKTRYIRAI
jgi:DNA-directed RNA polymerase subunit N (RpoN/RPB10)